jgi:hypothetical protein
MKSFTVAELSAHINTALNKLQALLDDYKVTNKKRAILLGYWISDYVFYISKEDTYNYPIYKYERGDIVQVNFGYRIGNEIGGRHFAVVVDTDNSIKQKVLTVVPLMSLKENSKDGKYTFTLSKGLFELHNDKLNKLNAEIKNSRNDINEMLTDPDSSNDHKKIINKLRKLQKQMKELQTFQSSIQKLKSGSIIDAGQIVTISKMRISNPKNSKDSLNRIKLSNEDLDTLNEKLKSLYINIS